MLEIILPCPNCQTSLLVDEQNAGTDVLCPGCEARLTLPQDLKGSGRPQMVRIEPSAARPAAEALAQQAQEPQAQAQAQVPGRKNHPLDRRGHLAPLPDEESPAAGQAGEHKAAHLPERRGLTAEEEMRRHAALTADPGKYDLHNVDTKGRTAFPCPACHRPVWISSTEWGREMECEACGEAIRSPNPSTEEPAKVLHAGGAEKRAKTVLPTRRQVEDLAVGEQSAAGRAKRQGGQLPAARELAHPPPADVNERARTKPPGREPIPARGDVEMSATVRKGPSARRNLPTPAEQTAAAAEFDDSVAADVPAETPGGKFGQRLGTDRMPAFTPKHDVDLSAEATGQWGGVGPQEQSPVFRRTLTIAVLTLLLSGVGLTTYLLSEYFREKPAGNPRAEEESPVQNVELSQGTLRRFFAAQTVEEMAKEVRHPEKTLPRMKAWYARNGIPRQTVEFTEDWREQDNWRQHAVNFIFTSIKIDGLPEREVALQTFEDGQQPKLDWEHFVSWSETPWLDFLSKTSEQPQVFRVAMTLLDYYNGFYSDRNRYLAFRVSDRGNTNYCYAYCENNSELGKALKAAVRGGRLDGRLNPESNEGVAQVILKLRFLPEGQKLLQANIEELVWDSWLEP